MSAHLHTFPSSSLSHTEAFSCLGKKDWHSLNCNSFLFCFERNLRTSWSWGKSPRCFYWVSFHVMPCICRHSKTGKKILLKYAVIFLNILSFSLSLLCWQTPPLVTENINNLQYSIVLESAPLRSMVGNLPEELLLPFLNTHMLTHTYTHLHTHSSSTTNLHSTCADLPCPC